MIRSRAQGELKVSLADANETSAFSKVLQ